MVLCCRQFHFLLAEMPEMTVISDYHHFTSLRFAYYYPPVIIDESEWNIEHIA